MTGSHWLHDRAKSRPGTLKVTEVENVTVIQGFQGVSISNLYFAVKEKDD